MPAVVTHNYFGTCAYSLIREQVGDSKDCLEAFLLGNQGPDPLFYLVMDPSLSEWTPYGTHLHREKTDDVLVAFRRSFDIIPKSDLDVARAYALGFLCHYLLDREAHPLVYAQEYALTEQGIPGLDKEIREQVHQTIECQIDEVMLFRHMNMTLREFAPPRHLLKADHGVLKTISTMYLYVLLTVFNDIPPEKLYARSIQLWRAALRLLYSKRGYKRSLIVRAEQWMRSLSHFGALCMRAEPREESTFENNDHMVWIDPSTGQERTECFENLFEAALGKVVESAELFLSPNFDTDVAHEITHGIEFNGRPFGDLPLLVEN